MHRTVYLTALLATCLFAASCSGTRATPRDGAMPPALTTPEDCRESGGLPVPSGTKEAGVILTAFGGCKFPVIYDIPAPADAPIRTRRSSQ